MRQRMLVAAALAAGLAMIPSPAGAKGAKEMTVVGPGLATPIRLANMSESPISPNLIAQESGLFGATAVRPLPARPSGRLGPRYVATYQWLVGPDTTTPLRQELYPFADRGAVSHMAREQRVLETTIPRGWYRAGPELTLLLVAAGVPVPERRPPRASAGERPERNGRGPSRG
ncbi:MAG TPA: hypothetical protein VKH36_08200 [Acidimicrobiia bacterium]|nr:hypothetical protein [Acidimicrobiia bacterium]